MAMHRTELKQFINCIKNQGSQSAIILDRVLEELAQHIPLVLHLADTPKQNEGGTITYEIIDPQVEINEIIYELSHTETAVVTVHDNGVTLNFNHIEISDDLVMCYLTTFDGSYAMLLSKEPGMSELKHTTNV